jgi:hypothetical protein
VTVEHPTDVEQLWQLGGKIHRLAWHGRYVYLAIGARLVAVDVGEPSQPVVVGESAPIGDTLEQVALDGTHAYAVTYDRLHIFEIGSSAAPRLMSELRGLREHTFFGRQIYLAGRTLYVSCDRDGSAQIVAVDVSDPRQPRVFGEPYPGVRIVGNGRYAYVANATGVDVLDVTDPSAPARLSSLTLSEQPGYVHVFDAIGNALWYSSGKPYSNGPVHTIDISDPYDPRAMGTFPRSADANAPAISGDRAYRATGADTRMGLSILDLADPGAPKIVGGYRVRDGIGEVVAQGPRVALSNFRGNWMVLLDTKDARNPDLVGSLHVSGWASAVAVAGEYAYVGMDDGLHVVTVADPSRPSDVGCYKMKGVRGVTLRGDYAWIHGEDEIRILDLADPARPVGVDAFRTGGRTDLAHGVILGDEYACILTGYARPFPPDIHVRRLDDPAYPTKVGDFHNELGIQALAVEGRHAVVVDESNAPALIDLASLQRIATVGEFPVGNRRSGVALHEGKAFIWAGPELHIVDLGDPVHPVELAVLRLEAAEQWAAEIHDVAVDGDRLYLATSTGLRTFDVTSRREPVEVDRQPHLRVDTHLRGDNPYWPRARVVVNRAPGGPVVISFRSDVREAVLVRDILYQAREGEGFWISRLADQVLDDAARV